MHMTTVVDLEIPAENLGLSETFERLPSFEFRIGGVIGDGPPLVWTSGADRSAIESALEADPSVDLVAVLIHSEDERLLVRLEFDRSMKLFHRIAAEHAGAVLEATGRDGTWSLTLLFHDREPLSRAHRRFERYGFEATVGRVATMDGADDDGTPLTETQYKTIATAYELGYFDVPRKVTLQELATELGISHQALSERLRRSHAALVGAELSGRAPPRRIDP